MTKLLKKEGLLPPVNSDSDCQAHHNNQPDSDCQIIDEHGNPLEENANQGKPKPKPKPRPKKKSAAHDYGKKANPRAPDDKQKQKKKKKKIGPGSEQYIRNIVFAREKELQHKKAIRVR